ncbi:hypothetical protein BC835DRAFT_132598 [Cytidiella melzeri]|nr:hypothetical protein BC835DRAFT_132598 [Cytidiella melzeri]
MRAASLFAALVACASVASAARVVITVGANKTANALQIFQPQAVTAAIGDVVVFNFTNGTYSAIQSDFAAPCIPINQFNNSINGFDSGARPANNGTTITTLEVPITTNDTIWFYDAVDCGSGGVGAINQNASSTATLAGFIRNAERLNGTATVSSAAPSATGSSSSSSSGGSSSSGNSSSSGGGDSSDSGVGHNAIVGVLVALPLAAAALLL